MRFPFIVIVAALSLVLMHRIKYTRKVSEKNTEKFWAREREANRVRKKDISRLDYVKVPLDRLPFGTDASAEVQALEEDVRRISETKMLNLIGETNTDLKLKYGAANMDELTACDERFMVLLRSMYQWSCLLLEHGYTSQAIRLAEESLAMGSDISGIYYMLADYYQSENRTDALEELQEKAQTIKGLQGKAIKEYISKSIS